MEEIFGNKKCVNHPDENFSFYCFDDKNFLCDNCFKKHRKHNIDLKSNLAKYYKAYSSINNSKNMYDNLSDLKNKLNDIKNDIENCFNSINSIMSLLENSKDNNSNKNNIFNLSFEEYDNIEKYKDIFNSLDMISVKFDSIRKIFYINNSTTTKEINKEVNIIENTEVNSYYNLDIMMNKKSGLYTLFEDSSKTHYVIFDLQKKYYINDVLISVKQSCVCVLKDFKISVKNDKGNWEYVNQFTCKDNKFEIDMQIFPVKREAQYIKIDFLNAWSKQHGNYILIRRLSFKVTDIFNS